MIALKVWQSPQESVLPDTSVPWVQQLKTLPENLMGTPALPVITALRVPGTLWNAPLVLTCTSLAKMKKMTVWIVLVEPTATLKDKPTIQVNHTVI